MAEWLKAIDCKSIRNSSRWFESNLFHTVHVGYFYYFKLRVSGINKNYYFVKKHHYYKKWRPFFSNNNATFWLKADWARLTKPLFLYNDLYASFKYNRNLRNYMLVEHRTHVFELFRTPSKAWALLKQERASIFVRFLSGYTTLFYQLLAENFFVFKNFRDQRVSPSFKLFFTFRTNKLFINMQNTRCENLIFLSLGFFLKYFAKRKALKKSKAFKLLLARSLRKLFLLARLHKFYFYIKGVPIHFVSMLKMLNKRIDHPFFNPYTKAPFNESPLSSKLTVIKVPYFFFLKNTTFVPVKTRKRGRIKRKLRRRLVAKNRVVD